ncbi:hypothetical protein, partial [Carnobacterium maltaromaticum]|uniref:hypothetical protein n=1 Tax=Carnobacterium maltaromaticum TaxID=2751 RepID=UPI00191BA3F8
MKKKLKEKQLKKMMKVSSKVLTMSAVSLLLSGSPLVTLTALAEESVSVTTETDASLMKEEIPSEKAVGRASYLGGRPEIELPSVTIDSNGQLKNGWYFKY